MTWYVFAITVDGKYLRSKLMSRGDAQRLRDDITQRQPCAKWFLGIGEVSS